MSDPITLSWSHPASSWSILVHGGAGEADRLPERTRGCEVAAAAAAAILAAGGNALDAVQRAVEILEDNPIFNAGTGACLNIDGAIELDASLMEGTTLRAGAVAALPPFKNPIAIARRVMDTTRHVLLAGDGAVRFALEQGFTRATLESMITEQAREQWLAARPTTSGGTVGAVARDARGAVAAATSTGGLLNKLAGRVGDSPIIGAGTYADDRAGACSTTGHGESMIRVCLAKTAVDATLRDPPEAAIRAALTMMYERVGGTAGAIVVAQNGALGLARTTRTMTWAAVADGSASSGA